MSQLPGFPFHPPYHQCPQEPLEPMSTTQLVFTVIPLSTITVIIIFGNMLVLLAFAFRPGLRTPPNAYLASLAGIDLSVGIFILPFNILLHVHQEKWLFGRILCKVWLTADVTLCSLSIFHLIAIALDRYRAITDGITYVQRRSFRSVVSVVFCLWVFSLWISSPPILGWNDWDENEVEICRLTESKGYVSHSTFGCFIFPMFLMLSLYWKIYKAIQVRLRERARIPATERSVDDEYCSETDVEDCSSIHHKERLKTLQRANSSFYNGSTNTGRPSQMQEFLQKKIKFSLSKERRAAKTVGIIVGAFTVCWIPFSILYGVSVYLPCEWKPSNQLFQAVTWLGYVNSGVNPIIYTIFNKKFRQAFKQLLHIA